MRKKVIITIPAYNEEQTIGKVLNELKIVMNKTNYNYKILVLDDGSLDNTVKVAKKYGVIIHSNKNNLGLIETFKVEMKKCIELGADIIVHTDADGQYRSKDIPRLIKKLESGYDLVVGSRFRHRNKNLPFVKNLGNRVFALVFSNILRRKITDTTSGFRAFTKDVAENIKMINNFTYTQEQLIRAYKMKYKVGEIGIKTRRSRKDSRLFKNPFQYAFKAWVNIFRIYRDYEPLKFFGFFGAIFIFVAFLIGLYFLYLHFTIGIRGHLGLLMLMIILASMGIQTVFFAFLADMKKSV
tara:strand:+ start:1819 stop:2709 length:891 start_codon:yes stop_codon:yes gene_type:complete